MTWILLALAGYICWALVNVGDKYIIHNRMPNFQAYFIWLALLGVPIAVIMIPFIGFYVLPIKALMLLIVASALFAYAAIPYAKAVEIEDITRINVWWSFVPIFTLIIAWFAIGERLSAMQFVAFCILIGANIVASLRFGKKKTFMSRGLWYMILASLGYGLYAVMLRSILQNHSDLVVFVWGILFTTIAWCLFLFSKPIRKAFMEYGRMKTSAFVTGVTSVAVLDALGFLFNIGAYALGPAALVAALSGSQSIFVFLIAAIVHIVNPRLLKEDFDKKNIVLKLVAIAFVVIGIVILNTV